MDFFISDLHDYDENIIMYEHRPFQSLKDMHDTIVKNCNKRVGKKDRLIIAGDIGNIDILGELNGQIYVVCGNHDNADEIREKFPNIKVFEYPIMIGGCWISHEPIGYMPPECPYLNIHGHLHRFIYGMEDRTWKGGNRYFNVSAERINYTPITLEEIGEIMEYKKI